MYSLLQSLNRKYNGFLTSILICWLGVLSIGPSSATTYFNWPWQLGIQFPALGLILLLILNLFFRRDEIEWNFFIRRHLLLSIGVSLTGIAWVASTLSSDFPWRSGFHLLIPVLAMIVGSDILVNLHTGSWKLKKVLSYFGVFGIFVCGISIIYWLILEVIPGFNALEAANIDGKAPYSWSALFYIINIYPFGHANYISGFVTLIIPPAIILAFYRKGWETWIWRILLFLALFVGWSCGSRAVWLSIGGTAFLGFFYYVILVRCEIRRTLLLGALLLLFISLLFGFHQRTRDSLLSLVKGEDPGISDSSRLTLIQTGIQMGMDAPLWGSGSGTVPLNYPRYWNGRSALTNAFQLHSTPVQIFVCWGLWGLFGCCLLLFAPFLYWHRQVKVFLSISQHGDIDAERIECMTVATAALAGIAAYLIFSFMDFQLDVVTIMGIFAFLYTVVIFISGSTGSKTDRKCLTHSRSNKLLERAILTVVIGFMGFYGLYQVQRIGGDLSYSRAIDLIDDGQWDEAVAQVNKALAFQPDDPFYFTHFGWILLKNRQSLGTSKVDDTVINLWSKSLEIWPDQAYIHYNLGWLFLNRDPLRSLAHFKKSAQLEPSKRGIYFGTAMALRKAGRDEELVVRALALECLIHPRFQFFSHWQTPSFMEIRPSVIAQWERLTMALDPKLKALSSTAYQQFRESVCIGRWWQDLNCDGRALIHSSYGQTRWLGMHIAQKNNDSKLIKAFTDQDNPPPSLIVRAFLEKESLLSSQLLEQAFINYSSGNHWQDSTAVNDLELIRRFMEENKGISFVDLLKISSIEQELPTGIYQNARLAFPFIYGHIGFEIPNDLFIYQQSILLELSLDDAFPARGFIPREMIEEFSASLFQ